MIVSDKANQIGESPTLKVTTKARAMKAAGVDVIDLSVGEPDFPTPDNIKSAGKQAIDKNFTKYTQADGIPALKDAIGKRLKEDLGLTYARNQIIVSSGAKSSLYHLLQALINEGDEVIIPAPYWVSYPHMVTLAKGKSVIIPTREENHFLLTPEQLQAAITPSTKALILNNPSNPTGSTYREQDLKALAEVILDEEIYVIADEIYEKLVYDDFRFVSFAALGEEIKKKTVIINGVSKAYSMTGWRIGYAAGPTEVIGAMTKIQGHTTSNPCSISQMASVEALGGPQYEINKMVSEFQRRRNYMLMRLKTIPNISCFPAKGAFYLFPNVSGFFDKEFNNSQIRNSYGLAYYLLKEAKVAIVPGGAFGAEENIRISYASSMETLEKGMDRIADALSKLKTAKKIKHIRLNNTLTLHQGSVPVDSNVSLLLRDGLVAEMESHLSHANYFEWNANINGVIVQLRTNVSHLYDFWLENWYPAQLESDLEPHGIIYALDGIPGREPRSYYNSESKTGVLVNTDNYGPLRSLALGLVMDVSERIFNVYSLRGMSADWRGNGLVLMGPKGTRKTELFFSLLQQPGMRLHANDMSYIRFSGNLALADSSERKLYMPTQTVSAYPLLAELFDNSKAENVITSKADCSNEKCLQEDSCRLDKGFPFCYTASPRSFSMLDPYWIEGPEKHVKRTAVRWIFILRNDKISPPFVATETEEALRILEYGETQGSRSDIRSTRTYPFFNPHLLLTNPERLEAQRHFFRRLLDNTRCYLFNSGAAEAADVMRIIQGERPDLHE